MTLYCWSHIWCHALYGHWAHLGSLWSYRTIANLYCYGIIGTPASTCGYQGQWVFFSSKPWFCSFQCSSPEKQGECLLPSHASKHAGVVLYWLWMFDVRSKHHISGFWILNSHPNFNVANIIVHLAFWGRECSGENRYIFIPIWVYTCSLSTLTSVGRVLILDGGVFDTKSPSLTRTWLSSVADLVKCFCTEIYYHYSPHLYTHTFLF